MMSIVAACCIGMVTSTGRAEPGPLGVKDGQLAPCPDTPNCVSSQATDAGHAIEPLTYDTAPAEAMRRLRQVVGAMPRTRVVSAADDYLHVEFTSAILRFVDDVEFHIDAANRRIHVRSASRVGRSDLGVNRKRVEAIRAAFNRGGPSSASPP